MKRKNIYIIISIAVFLIIALLIWWLLGRQAAINEDHISINFEIHNCSAVEVNSELLKNDFLRPLLTHSVITENNGLEDLIITKVTCNSQVFSIPAIGINSFRYNNSAPTLKESTMTSTSRSDDEGAFFSSWEADGYVNLENILLNGHPRHKENTDLAYLAEIIKSEGDELIPDSIIIDKNCQEQPPYLFSSTENFRKFLDDQLKKNKNALHENGKSGHIDIFIWCGEQYNTNPEDKDNDGVLNEFDKCPEQPGEISNNGCPIKDDTDKDGVYDDEDSCPKEKGDKSCDGCPCPPPIVEPDDDRDGISNAKDKCPKEFGFKKYQGCPIPDTDGDGINDEIDKCPTEKGPQSNNGCPINIRISHNNNDGKFIVGGNGFDFSKYKVYMKIKQSSNGPANGNILTFWFSTFVCPFSTPTDHEEANKIIKALKDPTDLVVTIYIDDLNGNNIKKETFKNLSMICFAGGDCGFVDLDKVD
ncbi:MAG: hypothetical protein RLZZ546_807 [Bacteroidota bacterium]|jgi:hypothetical protein